MEYIKVHIDEMFQKTVFFEYRLIEEDKSSDMVNRAFPFAKLIEKEPHIENLVKGTIIGIYYEQRGPNIVSECQWLDRSEELDNDTINYLTNLAIKVCVDKHYDEILKPPTIDEQVEEDFLAEFFEELSDDNEVVNVSTKKTISSQIEEKFNNTTLPQKDFLAEFFDQLEDE